MKLEFATAALPARLGAEESAAGPILGIAAVLPGANQPYCLPLSARMTVERYVLSSGGVLAWSLAASSHSRSATMSL